MPYQEQSIIDLVEKLPEVYQPIFKHPEFTAHASRICLDRLKSIVAVYDFISQEKGRPAKVLDLGCAQGFFSLSLAERGAIVTAVDYSKPNIDVCNKLAGENSDFNIEFCLGSIETIILEKIEDKSYDLVIGLSVFHHLVYENGAEYVFNLFKVLSEKIETGIFEFALNNEPLYWATAQPKDPRKLIDSYLFRHQLSMYETHLSSVERPLFLASNRYWNIKNQYGVIDKAMTRSHQVDNYFHDERRRYYFSNGLLVKVFFTNDAGGNNFWEISNESTFLEKQIPGFRSSKLVDFGFNENEAWLVRTAIPGRLLLDIILSGEDYDDEMIIAGILDQVTILENHDLYHNDLRPWNILIGDDSQVYLIDYGSIFNSPADGDDLYGQILSFFTLVKEISQHRIGDRSSQRPHFISPHDFPEKYRKWVSKVWLMPSHNWCFEKVSAAYSSQDDIISDIPISAILESNFSIVTNHIDWKLKKLQDTTFEKIDALDSNIFLANQSLFNEYEEARREDLDLMQQLLSRVEKILIESCPRASSEKIFNDEEQVPNRKDLKESVSSLAEVEINRQKEIANELRNEIDSVYRSNSWKITYPLRSVKKIIKLFFRPHKVVSAFNSAAKIKSRVLVSVSIGFVYNRPILKQRALRFLNKHPKLKYKIKRRISQNYENAPPVTAFMDVPLPKKYSEPVEQGKNYIVKKSGKHESQKSVLESWFY